MTKIVYSSFRKRCRDTVVNAAGHCAGCAAAAATSQAGPLVTGVTKYGASTVATIGAHTLWESRIDPALDQAVVTGRVLVHEFEQAAWSTDANGIMSTSLGHTTVVASKAVVNSLTRHALTANPETENLEPVTPKIARYTRDYVISRYSRG